MPKVRAIDNFLEPRPLGVKKLIDIRENLCYARVSRSNRKKESTSMPEKTNVQEISAFFFQDGTPASTKLAEIKALTTDDRYQLGEGIRNGTFTY